jgi:hypothetical protein
LIFSLCNFYLCALTDQLRPRPLHCPSFQITHTHTVALLWTSDRLSAATAIYINTQRTQDTNIYTGAGFEPAIPEIERSLHRMVTVIGRDMRYGLDRAGSGQGQVAGTWDCGNEPACS